jgi:hypothetical protein
MNRLRKIVIRINDPAISDADALTYVGAVMDIGRVSVQNHRRAFAHLTKFLTETGTVYVRAEKKNSRSDTFTLTLSSHTIEWSALSQSDNGNDCRADSSEHSTAI